MGEQGVLQGESLCVVPVLRISIVEVLLPSFTTWGMPVSKSRTQLHRDGFRPRALSLVTSLEGTIVFSCCR